MRLKEKLQGLVPEECLNRLSNRFHVIGDIAVLYLPREAEPHKKEIAYAVLSSGRSIRIVLNKTTKLQGDGRVAAAPSPRIENSDFPTGWTSQPSSGAAV